MNILINFVILSLVLWIGFDMVVRICNPRIHQSYRQVTGWILRHIRRQISRCAGFLWGRYRQFILGAISMFFFLLLTGRLVV